MQVAELTGCVREEKRAFVLGDNMSILNMTLVSKMMGEGTFFPRGRNWQMLVRLELQQGTFILDEKWVQSHWVELGLEVHGMCRVHLNLSRCWDLLTQMLLGALDMHPVWDKINQREQQETVCRRILHLLRYKFLQMSRIYEGSIQLCFHYHFNQTYSDSGISNKQAHFHLLCCHA